MNLQWFSIAFTAITLVLGLVHHYVFVREQLVIMREKIAHLEEKVESHAEAIPKIFELLAKMNTNIEVIKSKFENASNRTS